ncbi:MAG: TetR family transcriptional regulator [Solirubrobacterales bacterium]|nr:TetR family transcriptional regulator [Solirubrobacterales bacterium]
MLPDSPTGRYGGASANERRTARRERLLDAGFELLGTEGWSGTTVRRVCQRAALNPRYFYESFGDLDALLLAVFDRGLAEATERILVAYVTAPEEAHPKAEAAIGAFVEFVTEDPRWARIAFVEALGNEALARRRLETLHGMSQLVAARAREFYGVEGDPDPIGDVAAALLVGGIAELVIAWLDGRLHVTRERLVEDVVELFVITGEGAVAIARRRARAAKRARGGTA